MKETSYLALPCLSTQNSWRHLEEQDFVIWMQYGEFKVSPVSLVSADLHLSQRAEQGRSIQMSLPSFLTAAQAHPTPTSPLHLTDFKAVKSTAKLSRIISAILCCSRSVGQRSALRNAPQRLSVYFISQDRVSGTRSLLTSLGLKNKCRDLLSLPPQCWGSKWKSSGVLRMKSGPQEGIVSTLQTELPPQLPFLSL